MLFCSVLVFIIVTAFWSLNYIASEIEMPFGDDENDLPIAELQVGWNAALVALLNPMTKKAPVFVFDPEMHTPCLREPCPAVLAGQNQYGTFNKTVSKTARAVSSV